MSSVKQLSELEQMYGGRLTPNGMKDIDYNKEEVGNTLDNYIDKDT